MVWDYPKDQWRYGEALCPGDSAFDQSEDKKKHERKVIDYEKFLGEDEIRRQLILQAADSTQLEVLEEDNIGYGWRTSYSMLKHLRSKISNVMNKDKVTLEM